jgi:hypothetical protein
MVKKARKGNFNLTILDSQESSKTEMFPDEKISNSSTTLVGAETTEVSYENKKVEKRFKPNGLNCQKKAKNYAFEKDNISCLIELNIELKEELNVLIVPKILGDNQLLNSKNSCLRIADFMSKHDFKLECR